MKPWYKVVTPREDLRSGKPLDASEFAVHLQHVRDGRAAAVYQDPAEFFERTFLTKTLGEFAIQVLRRLNGIKLETSAVFDLSTQFGGGKTHSLTLAFHLAQHGCSDSRCARRIVSDWRRRRSRRCSERIAAVAGSTEPRGRSDGVRSPPRGRSVPVFS